MDEHRDEIIGMDGFGEVLHNNIHEWFRIPGNMEILNLMKVEVTFTMNTQTNAVVNTENPFAGKTVTEDFE